MNDFTSHRSPAPNRTSSSSPRPGAFRTTPLFVLRVDWNAATTDRFIQCNDDGRLGKSGGLMFMYRCTIMYERLVGGHASAVFLEDPV